MLSSSQSNQSNSMVSKSFQKFLDTLIQPECEITIKQESLRKHSTIILLNPFEIKTVNSVKRTARGYAINISEIVLNNIVSLHTLMLDQSLEEKQFLLAEHKKFFREALGDFFLDYQEKFLSENYKRDLIIKELPEDYEKILDEFIEASINIHFKEKQLKDWTIQYSTLGFVSSEYDPKAAREIFYGDERSDSSPSDLQGRQKISGGYRISYGRQAQDNLITLMGKAAKNNLLLLMPQQENRSVFNLPKVWQDLRNEQFKQFRKITHVKYNLFWVNAVLPILLVALAIVYFGPTLLVLGISAIVLVRVSVVVDAIFKYDRVIKDEFKFQNDLCRNRKDMVDLLYKEYQPKKMGVEFEAQNQSADTKAIIIYPYEHFVAMPSVALVNAHVKKSSNVKANRKSSVHETKKALLLSQIKQQREKKGQEKAEPMVWKDTKEEIFHPPTKCYEIQGTKFTYPPHGYFTKNAWSYLKSQITRKKKDENKKGRQAKFFKVVPAETNQGVVLFNREERKIFGYHSKVKVKGEGSVGTVRIFGTVVARSKNGQPLICYHRAEEPPHTKQSL